MYQIWTSVCMYVCVCVCVLSLVVCIWLCTGCNVLSFVPSSDPLQSLNLCLWVLLLCEIIHPPHRCGTSRCWLDSMIIAQVCLRLATIKSHSKIWIFITQHNATDVAILRERAIVILTTRMSTRAVAHELNVHFSTISCLQRCFGEFGSTSNRPHNRRPHVTTPVQDLHIQHLHIQDRLRPATRTAAATIGLHNQRISAQTVRNRLREAHKHARHPHRGLDLTAVRRRNRLEWTNAHIRWHLALWRGVLLMDESSDVFTVQARWQTACMALFGWEVCWCQGCGWSGPWWRWGYGMGRRMLWTTNTGAFYYWHFECTKIPWRNSEAHCCAIHHDHHLMLQHDNARPHVARICTQFLEAENIPVLAWPAYLPDISPI